VDERNREGSYLAAPTWETRSAAKRRQAETEAAPICHVAEFVAANPQASEPIRISLAGYLAVLIWTTVAARPSVAPLSGRSATWIRARAVAADAKA
jgi:hypothetical protein